MATAYEIPLVANPQNFSIALGGVSYNLNVYWNVAGSVWCLDIADSLNNKILSGIPLVTGTDLLAPYAYLNFGGKLIAQTDQDLTAPPTFDNLGTAGHLYFVV